MRSGNQRIRDELKSPELDNSFQEMVAASPLEEKGRSTMLSWIRAVRDECSGALRKSQDYSALISRMAEYQIRSSLFELLALREPERAQKQKLQGELLNALLQVIRNGISRDDDASDIMNSYAATLANLLPGVLPSDNELSHNGPLLVVETDYKQETYQLPADSGTEQETTDSLPFDPKPEAAERSALSDAAETLENAPPESTANQELISLREENQELKKKLNDFLEEWGEGIRIDGRTVSILTHRKIIVKKSSQGSSE